ncbi:MAG: BlaI/MecI/CopY family transcriptional regulator [Oscillibacter sp.]|jgi:BlaI family penicillinase repressor|nr:BlaI/MecI/CopY family transcriptional regulator [uncultured Oscillibacter sp.]MCI8970280.1 BlaI/MecI/CopY family transcriptional regulator [Oscillibacter sp.]
MEHIKLASSEWNVLNCLWEEHPRTVMQIVNELEKTVGWHRSTTITTLHRMEAKGLIGCRQAGRGKAYVPLVDRDGAETAETRSFLDRVYRGSVGMMMSAMAQRRELSGEEIAELRAILDQAEKEGVQ